MTCLVVGVNDDFLVGTRPFNTCRGTPTQTSKTPCISFLLPCWVRKSQHAHALGDMLVHLDAGRRKTGDPLKVSLAPMFLSHLMDSSPSYTLFSNAGPGKAFSFCKHIYGSREPPWGRVTRGFKQQNVDGHPVV